MRGYRELSPEGAVKFVERIPQGHLMRRGYGVVRFDLLSYRTVTAPMPFHLVMRYAGRFYWFVALLGADKASRVCHCCNQRFDGRAERLARRGGNSGGLAAGAPGVANRTACDPEMDQPALIR